MNSIHTQLWQQWVAEAQWYQQAEPLLSTFYRAAILSHDTLISALSHHIASKLSRDVMPLWLIKGVAAEVMDQNPSIIENACLDLEAYRQRDPACGEYAIPFLYFKGFQALLAYRVAHQLWQQGRQTLARFLQHSMVMAFDVDIHPAATMGHGIMMDHATGVVIGQTAVIGNDVSLLHSVTLGSCGGERCHPKVEDGVLISTGAKLLGDITIGTGAKIAAGSVVLSDVPAHTTVAGVPAKVVGHPLSSQPALDMGQQIE